MSRTKKIEVNSNDNRAWLYKAVWYLDGFIKLKSNMVYFGVMKYAKLIVL